MKIEAGKKYVTRSGSVVGPMKAEGALYIEKTPGVKSISRGGIRESWNADGSVCMGLEADYPNEIVSEFVPSLKIEIGKTYKARNGLTIGPMIHSEGCIDSRTYPFSVSHSIPSHYGKAWREDGTFSPSREPHDLDLLSEVFTLREGGYYLSKSGVVVGPLKSSGWKDWMICENKSLREVGNEAFSQAWESNGSVATPREGEEGHVLIQEMKNPDQTDEEPKLSIRAGSYYLTAEGVVEGPMFRDRECWKSENPKTMQKHSRGRGQIWGDDGSVSVMVSGEEGHRLVREVPAPPQHSEIERLKAVIASQKEKLDRVQNIHANTIKTLRKARADVKKVNKALSDEQGRTHSLINRLSEVVKAATDADDYAKGIERTAPKKRRAIEKVDVGETVALDPSSLRNLIGSERNHRYLMTAFLWFDSPQGRQYWSGKYHGRSPINADDILFFKALLDKHNSSK